MPAQKACRFRRTAVQEQRNFCRGRGVTQIRLGYNAVPDGAEKDIVSVFRSGQYSPGKKCLEFEKKFANLHGAKYAHFVNSGTDALRLGLLALKEKNGWRDGDEVAVPALTFPASINTIIQANLTPFLIDVGMYDYLINPDNLRRRMEGKTHPRLRAIMPVHLFGQSCANDIFDFAKDRGLRVIEDSCETILNPIRGDVSCHSTYMAHHVTTGVGGMALTNDKDLSRLIWSYANHGRREPGKFQFDRIGYSCRATEFEAVMGLSQLGTLKKSVAKRRAIFVSLLNVFGKFDDLDTVGITDNTAMMFPVEIKESSKIKKKSLCAYLKSRGIETRDLMPVTNQLCYKSLIKNEFPVSDRLNKTGFYIPCHPEMTMKDVNYIAETFQRYLTKR